MDEWGVEDVGGAGDVEEELVEARERRQQGGTELVKVNVRVGLDEKHALSGAVNGELAAFKLPQPAGQRVVVHKCRGDCVPEHWRRVVVPAAVATEEVDHWDVEAEPVLVWSSMSESGFSSRGVGPAGATSTAGFLRTVNCNVGELAMPMRSAMCVGGRCR